MKNKYAIQIIDGGEPVGYVGKRILRYERKKDRLLADYAIVETSSDAMRYVTKAAAEKFASDFNSDTETSVTFHVVKVIESDA